ncbi:MAG: hypothetical protein QOJ29_3647 [Thermoleophilaceae bacterium]|nr:hypothetical protein [Thermoleophilaceae bacterium]
MDGVKGGNPTGVVCYLRRLQMRSVFAAIAVTVVAALAPIAVEAAILRPSPVSPSNKALLPVRKTPTFKVRSTGKGSVWIHISKSANKKADGVIANDASIGQAKKSGKYFVYHPQFFDYPAFWANQAKRWYWQSYRIACGEEAKSSDCKVEGPVRSFRLH